MRLMRYDMRRWMVCVFLCYALTGTEIFAGGGKKQIMGVKIKGRVVFFLEGSWNSQKVQITGNTVLPKGEPPYHLDAVTREGSGKLYSIRFRKAQFPDVGIGIIMNIDGTERISIRLKDMKDGDRNELFRIIINKSVTSRAYILEFLKPVGYQKRFDLKLILEDPKGTTVEGIVYYKTG